MKGSDASAVALGQSQELDDIPTMRRRFSAAMINALVPATCLAIGAGAALHLASAMRTTTLITVTGLLVANAIRQIWSLGRTGRNPGLAACGLSVVDQDRQAPLGWRAAIRQSLFAVLAVTGVGWVISAAMAWRDQRRRAIHDRVAHSVVVSGAPRAAAGRSPEHALEPEATQELPEGTRWELAHEGRVVTVAGRVLLGSVVTAVADEDVAPAVVLTPVDEGYSVASWSQLVIEDTGSALMVHDLGWNNEASVTTVSGRVQTLLPFAPVELSSGDTIEFGQARIEVLSADPQRS